MERKIDDFLPLFFDNQPELLVEIKALRYA